MRGGWTSVFPTYLDMIFAKDGRPASLHRRVGRAGRISKMTATAALPALRTATWGSRSRSATTRSASGATSDETGKPARQRHSPPEEVVSHHLRASRAVGRRGAAANLRAAANRRTSKSRPMHRLAWTHSGVRRGDATDGGGPTATEALAEISAALANGPRRATIWEELAHFLVDPLALKRLMIETDEGQARTAGARKSTCKLALERGRRLQRLNHRLRRLLSPAPGAPRARPATRSTSRRRFSATGCGRRCSSRRWSAALDEAARINRNLAQAAQAAGIAMSVGSLRCAIEEPALAATLPRPRRRARRAAVRQSRRGAVQPRLRPARSAALQ